MRQSRNVFVVAAVIVVLALIGLGIYQWRTTSETELPSADAPRETTSEATVAAPAWITGALSGSTVTSKRRPATSIAPDCSA